ncbi:Hypothetical_protein [Hexamita inflata]|uniref:Hypothetical_protein n=1 Tax=Hexamita inflata TaxID=28002 RepID=A0AA86R686_9EUKA|nr:Hypothetical protein HINF_LOCUS55616 [Hexamita inflata]
MQNESHEPKAAQSVFNMDQLTQSSFYKLLLKALMCQCIYYLPAMFVIHQEQYILTSLKGYDHIKNCIKIFPIIFFAGYELPEFFEQYFANQKMATYANGNSVPEQLRIEFITNMIYVLILIVLPAIQSYLFSIMQVENDYRARYLLSTVLGLIGPFRSTIYSLFSYKQQYTYILSGKIVTLMLQFFLFTFIYSFYTREDGAIIDVWPSGFAKPFAEILVYTVIMITLYKGTIFSTRIHLDADQSTKISIKPQKKDWKPVFKNVGMMFPYAIYYLSRPIVYLTAIHQILSLTDASKKEQINIDIYIYMFCQLTLSMISKGAQAAIMTVIPILFHTKHYSKMRAILSYGTIAGLVITEALCILIVMKPEIIFQIVFCRFTDTKLQTYYENGSYKNFLTQTALWFGTDSIQSAPISFSILTGGFYVPLIMGALRIAGGIYFCVQIQTALGQNADYTDVFMYFEIVCFIVGAVFCACMYLTIFTEYKVAKKKEEKKKTDKVDEFMVK